jgi:hypothetical protein
MAKKEDPEFHPEIKNRLFHPELAMLFDVVNRELAPKDIPLDPKDSRDPFYHAQLLQYGLVKAANAIELTGDPTRRGDMSDMTVQKVMAVHAVEVLNKNYASEIRNKRLAVSAAYLVAIYRDKVPPHGPYFEDEAVISGIFHRFDFAEVKGMGTLVALLAHPHFLDPDYMDASRYKGIAIPALEVTDWTHHASVN